MLVRDFQDSTLWQISGFNRAQQPGGHSGFARLEGPTLLPTTLLADLRRLDADPTSNDVIEVIAACMRHRESALLCLRHDDLVWPVTLFPAQSMYHSPRDLNLASPTALAALGLVTIEPPGVRAPGDWMLEPPKFPPGRMPLDTVNANTAPELSSRSAAPSPRADLYRPLLPLVWMLALRGPRRALLAEIAGPAAYRAIRNPADEGLLLSGAMAPALEHLRRESVSVRNMATWPGMSVERCCRLLNALYLTASLLVSRTHPAARAEPEEASRRPPSSPKPGKPRR